MAAYATLVSLMNTIQQIMNHPHLSTSFDENQIKSLGEKFGFLLDFIENYNSHGVSKEVENLEIKIASAAHEAEDVIESHIVDQILDDGETSSSFLVDLQKIRSKVDHKFRQLQQVILAGSTDKSPNFLLDLQGVMKDMDCIKKKIVKIEKKCGFKDQQPTYSVPTSSSRPLAPGKSAMVGFNDELIQLMDVLTGQQPSLQIISIVGMGGMGKTTLARNVYENSLIMQHFDIRAWATISQGYNVREILLRLLSFLDTVDELDVDESGEQVDELGKRNELGKHVDKLGKHLDELGEHELGERLYKSLSGRRYLIMFDDIWSSEVWDTTKFFFPDNGYRSRVVITTRLLNVAIHFGSCFRMNFLDEDKSWNLFCQEVFGQEECPSELVEIGKKIVEQCKGLPLSIVVIGGLLRKSYRTKGYWQNVAKNINSIFNSKEKGQCLDVLYLSYTQLPAHLKPCFLYMGAFQEDCEIHASEIIKLWVAEGFLRPNGVQILEEIAEGYLKDLADRNLILVSMHRPNGKIKSCRIHDLLRDLCLRVAKKEKFFCVVRALSIPRGIDRERRLIFHSVFSSNGKYKVFEALQSASLARSLICGGAAAPVKCRLLRVLNKASDWSMEAKFQNVNLRYFAYQRRKDLLSRLPSSISLIWNLQTLIIRSIGASEQLIVAPLEIWKMPQLRHLNCRRIYLPDPPPSDEEDDSCILGNLQTLTEVVNFRLNEEASKRIPDIKKLTVVYIDNWKGHDDRLPYNLYNLGRLHKLESLNISCHRAWPTSIYQLTNAFPSSLNKLSITDCVLPWDNMTMIGTLPQLEVLKLETNFDGRGKWSPVEGEFRRLKYLSISNCNLRCWNADSSHFPVLEKLVLEGLDELDEIPWGIGEIPTLQLIRLDRCGESAAISAMKIKEEQESLGNDGLQIQVSMYPRDRRRLRERVEIEGLSMNNIQLLDVVDHVPLVSRNNSESM